MIFFPGFLSLSLPLSFFFFRYALLFRLCEAPHEILPGPRINASRHAVDPTTVRETPWPLIKNFFDLSLVLIIAATRYHVRARSFARSRSLARLQIKLVIALGLINFCPPPPFRRRSTTKQSAQPRDLSRPFRFLPLYRVHDDIHTCLPAGCSQPGR